MEETDDKNISFPESIVENISKAMPDGYLDAIKKASIRHDDRMKMSKKDFLDIRSKYGTVLGNSLDSVILNPPHENPIDEIKEMSLTEKAASFVTEITKSAKTGFRLAPKGEIEKRKTICQSCPHWSGDAYMGKGKCKICGCSGLKLILSTTSCPINKWTAYQEPDSES